MEFPHLWCLSYILKSACLLFLLYILHKVAWAVVYQAQELNFIHFQYCLFKFPFWFPHQMNLGLLLVCYFAPEVQLVFDYVNIYIYIFFSDSTLTVFILFFFFNHLAILPLDDINIFIFRILSSFSMHIYQSHHVKVSIAVLDFGYWKFYSFSNGLPETNTRLITLENVNFLVILSSFAISVFFKQSTLNKHLICNNSFFQFAKLQ